MAVAGVIVTAPLSGAQPLLVTATESRLWAVRNLGSVAVELYDGAGASPLWIVPAGAGEVLRMPMQFAAGIRVRSSSSLSTAPVALQVAR